jgi:hypothetical protein
MEAIISSYQKLEIAFTELFLDGEEITSREWEKTMLVFILLSEPTAK